MIDRTERVLFYTNGSGRPYRRGDVIREETWCVEAGGSKPSEDNHTAGPHAFISRPLAPCSEAVPL